MNPIQDDLEKLRLSLRRGSIQRAYRAILDFMMALRKHLKEKHPTHLASDLYQGYLDMSYFAVVPPSLKRHRLKIAIVFNFEAFRFEAWLAAANRQVQRKYWELLKGGRWPDYRVVAPGPGIDSIVECDLAEEFDLSRPGVLASAIERKIDRFTKDIEAALRRQPG